MYAAIPYNDGKIEEQFDTARFCKIYDIENDRVIRHGIAETHTAQEGDLILGLKKLGVEVLICNKIRHGTLNFAVDQDLILYVGITGDADDAIRRYLRDELESDTGAVVHCGRHGK